MSKQTRNILRPFFSWYNYRTIPIENMIVSICAIIKDEHLYLDEWIQYHLSIGIDSILLCEDIGSKSHKDITDKYDNVHLITYNEEMDKYISYDVPSRQYKYYKYFLDKNPLNCDWVAFIDIDEFVYIENKDIKTFLQGYSNYDGIYLAWKIYGANGHIKRPEGLVQDNYTPGVILPRDRRWNYKSIVNMHGAKELKTVHHVLHGVATNKLPSVCFKTFSHAYIKHYFTKSWEDWAFKILSRGDLVPNHRKLNEFFEVNPDMLSVIDECYNFINNNTNNMVTVTKPTTEEVKRIAEKIAKNMKNFNKNNEFNEFNKMMELYKNKFKNNEENQKE